MDATEEALTIVRVRAWLRSGRAREIRRRAGLSQGDVARVLGTTYSQVCRWETGKAVPVRGAVLRLAELYGKLEEIAEAADAVASAQERGLVVVAPGAVTVDTGDW
jgi:transcriptional regulator with XRE-family HTH domain